MLSVIIQGNSLAELAHTCRRKAAELEELVDSQERANVISALHAIPNRDGEDRAEILGVVVERTGENGWVVGGHGGGRVAEDVERTADRLLSGVELR